MSLILSGTDGLSDVDGTAATPALRGTDANTGIFFGADIIGFSEGGVEAVRIDASGNLLVGTTTPQTGAKLAVTGGIQGTIASGTAVASTSGTSIDFTSIPSWVKRITVMFSGVSLSGGDSLLVQIGDSGGIENTGYISTSAVTGAGTSQIASTSGFVIYQDAATEVHSGIAIITNITSNSWVFSHTGKAFTNKCSFGGGNKDLSGTLDRIRITTTGTNTFDAGTVNIMYEG